MPGGGDVTGLVGSWVSDGRGAAGARNGRWTELRTNLRRTTVLTEESPKVLAVPDIDMGVFFADARFEYVHGEFVAVYGTGCVSG